MKKYLLRIIFLISLPLFSYTDQYTQEDRNDLNQDYKLLPESIEVYYNKNDKTISAPKNVNKTIVNNRDNFNIAINVNSDYRGFPGCYIACFSSQDLSKENMISFSDTKYLLGLIRVSGYHKDKDCIIKGYEFTEVSETEELSRFCAQYFPSYCDNNNCWAENKTSIYWKLTPYTLSARRGLTQ